MTLPRDFEELLALAREHRPDTSRAELGFEARLMARIREARQSGGASLWDEALSWVWRSAAGLAPVVAVMLVWFFLAHGLRLEVPPSAGEALDFLGSYFNLPQL